MKLLVYAILREGDVRAGRCVPGLDGGPVRFITAAPLAAACSLWPAGENQTTSDVPRLLAYAKVIENLSQDGTVLPMRYGCWLNSEAEVIELLDRKSSLFTKTLEEIDGRVEMSLRVLSAKQADRPVLLDSSGPKTEVPDNQAVGGAAYLARRQAYFAAQDQNRSEAEGLTALLCSAFNGLFVKCQPEGASGAAGFLMSLHFLVRQEKVDLFRERFRQLQASRPERLLLSGPWPPYNFVAS